MENMNILPATSFSCARFTWPVAHDSYMSKVSEYFRLAAGSFHVKSITFWQFLCHPTPNLMKFSTVGGSHEYIKIKNKITIYPGRSSIIEDIGH